MRFLTIEQADEQLGLPRAAAPRLSIASRLARSEQAVWTFPAEAEPRGIAWLLVDAMPYFSVAAVLLRGAESEDRRADPNLYERYRLSLGGGPDLAAAPVHLFRAHDAPHLITLLFMTIAFGWEATLYSNSGDCFSELGADHRVFFETSDAAVLEKLRAPEAPGLIALGDSD